ncbi:hypothetical protein ACFLRA_02220 [Bdellovibrionota bacterium]
MNVRKFTSISIFLFTLVLTASFLFLSNVFSQAREFHNARTVGDTRGTGELLERNVVADNDVSKGDANVAVPYDQMVFSNDQFYMMVPVDLDAETIEEINNNCGLEEEKPVCSCCKNRDATTEGGVIACPPGERCEECQQVVGHRPCSIIIPG